MKIWRLSAAVGIAVVLALAPAVTASAAGQLELSNDGVTFGTTLAAIRTALLKDSTCVSASVFSPAKSSSRT